MPKAKPVPQPRRRTVYFATNRQPIARSGNDETIIDFTADLGPVDGTAVRFGRADVDVTPDGASFQGTLVPGSLHVAPEQLIFPKDGEPTRGSRDIFEQLRQDMKAGGRPTIVVVHGFSNSFADAIERAATIAEFYGIDGNVFSFTWPSRGSVLGPVPLPYADYAHDRHTASRSGVAMARTLHILYRYIDKLSTAEFCRQPLHLICHSMGNFAFRHAVQALLRMQTAAVASTGGDAGPLMTDVPTDTPDPNRLRRTFDQIILAAADEDEDAFEDPEEFKYLPRLGNAVTVYHTKDDWILSTLSRVTKFNGPRLGMDGPNNMSAISDKVVAVDVSAQLALAEDIQNHQYYRIFPRVRDDIVDVLSGKSPDKIKNRQLYAPQRYRLK